MSAPSEIVELVERFSSRINEYRSSQYNETELRGEFVNPFFAALGWDVHNQQCLSSDSKEVKLEESIRVEENIKNPDYSFRLGKSRRFFVETKKPSINIEGGVYPAFQLRRYAWSASLSLSILTDFEEFAVYDCRAEPSKTDKPGKGRLLYLQYDQYVERWDEIAALFSKEAVLRGSLDRFIESIPEKRGIKRVDTALLEEISLWREALARNLALRNPALSQRDLNFSVQRTIDRLLFLRICEDRAIEEYGRLKALLKEVGVYAHLLKLFAEADLRYNSGIFHFQEERERKEPPDSLTTALIIDDDTLKEIIQDLYFPDSPYVFSEIPAEILGQVYEQFLGKVIRLEEGHKAIVEDKPEVRKAGGVYYTPSYIVEYIVKNTVGKLLEGSAPARAAQLCILDPACGSGSFLIGAYQFLLDWHMDWYRANLVPLLEKNQSTASPEVLRLLPAAPEPRSDRRARKIHARAAQASLPIFKANGSGNEWRLTTTERKRILQSNIYGVDIDPQAVEVTKLSLLLKVLEGETEESISSLLRYFKERALPDLGSNIKCGNSLIGYDYYDDHKNLSSEEVQRINAFEWKTEYPEIFERGGFDAVIGNPPYVRQESLGVFKGYFQKHYKVFQGTADLYTYFVERGVSLLRETGIFSYIVANKWMRANYGQPMRKWLKKQCIEEIIDFGDLQMFQGATAYPCIIRITKNAPQTCFNVTQVKTLNFSSLSDYVKENHYNMNQDTLDDKGWSLVDERTQNLMGKINSNSVPLGKYVGEKIYRGVLTGLNEAFVIDAEIRKKLIEDDKKSAELIKPFLVGKDIRRYEPTVSDKYLIFIPRGWTKERSNNACEALNWFKNSYPAIANHLLPFAESAEKRWDKGEYWWELRACDYYDEFEKTKILWPGISAQVVAFAFDDKGHYGNDNNHLIISDDKYLLGIINSNLIRMVLTSICDKVQGGFYRIKIIYVKQLPIRTIDFSNIEDVARHDRMVELVQSMLDLHRLASAGTDHDKTLLARQIEATNRQIDRLVYELYDLTEEEIGIVETASK